MGDVAAVMKQNTKKLLKISKWLVLIVAGVITVWDLYAQFTGGTGGTISNAIWLWSKDNQILPFMFGVLMGHLFWQVEKPK